MRALVFLTAHASDLLAQCFLDSREVMPAVPHCMVLEDELRSDRRIEAEAERCGCVELLVCH